MTSGSDSPLTSRSAVVSGPVDLVWLGPNALLKINLYSMPYLHPSALVPHTARRSGVASASCETAAGPCATDADVDGVPSRFVRLAYDCDESDPAVGPFQSGAGEAGDGDGVDNNCDGWELP